MQTLFISFVFFVISGVELVGTKHRNVYGMTYAALYSLGIMYLPLAAFVTRHYFTFQIAATAPMLLMLFYPW